MRPRERGSAAGRALALAVPLLPFLLLLRAGAPHPRPEEARGASAPESGANLAVFAAGEVLTYEVSYLSIRLGSIVTRVTGIDTARGRVTYRTECFVRTYKGVPFVTLDTRFQSTISDSLASVSFSTREWLRDTTHKYITYTFAPNYRSVRIQDRIGNRPVTGRNDTLSLDGKRWLDGLSILFYARAMAHRHADVHVPVLIYHDKATTHIRFGVAREGSEIDAVDYPVATDKIDGETGFTGIFGLTGGFEGWFSRDAAAVPIAAKMHVLIGSIRLELISWKRPGWTPPRETSKG